MTKETIEKFYTGKNDIVFKCVFLDENDTYLLQEFLTKLLKRKVNKIIFKREYQHKDYAREKTRILDFLADVDGDMIHIELNASYKDYYNVRNFSYFTTVYNRHIKSGDDYDLETKFLHIDLSYDLKDNEDECRIYFIIDRNGNKYIENFEIIEYNMNRFMKYYEEKNEEKLKEYSFLIMLGLEKEQLESFTKGDDFMEKFNEKINELNKDPEFQSFMTAEEDYQKCINTDLAIARKEGREEGKIEIAKIMLENGEDIDKICLYSKLSKETIIDLNNK